MRKARAEYTAVRQVFLDSAFPLYTVCVFDDGSRCTPVPGRFFASVNGNMIEDGLLLAQFPGKATYYDEAIATSQAVTTHLADAAGVFTDLQAENDIVEPLIEAMADLALTQQHDFARQWLLNAASASASAESTQGTYGRFFDGPVQRGTSTSWQINGGFALAVAAAEIASADQPVTASAWSNARSVQTSFTPDTFPVTIAFTGKGIALLGTLGERCCEPGHARLFINGTETVDTTGIWQNTSSTGLTIPNTVLFAWRWPVTGTHTIRIDPGVFNIKEGGAFIDISSYLVLP